MQLRCSWRGAGNMGLAAFFRCFSALRLHVSALFAGPLQLHLASAHRLSACRYLHGVVNDLVCSFLRVGLVLGQAQISPIFSHNIPC